MRQSPREKNHAPARETVTEPEMTAVCMFCGKTRLGSRKWVNADPATLKFLSHSVCPSCYGRALHDMLREIREEMGLPA